MIDVASGMNARVEIARTKDEVLGYLGYDLDNANYYDEAYGYTCL